MRIAARALDVDITGAPGHALEADPEDLAR
jgi:hypothetical protein